MKVLLYSHSFYPAIGGVETVSMMLADGLTQRKLECKVVTRTSEGQDRDFIFPVFRNPGRAMQKELVAWADVVLFNGASLALQPWILLLRKPFIWIHVGYQVSCVDGLGWINGAQAPLKPLASVWCHLKRNGLIEGAGAALKLLIRRIVAHCLVAKNVAITEWMNSIQPLPRQVLIYNPFPLKCFQSVGSEKPEFEFLFVGRLVSEKGLITLFKAFKELLDQSKRNYRLLVIGEGPCRSSLEQFARQEGIANNIVFAGAKSGAELLTWVAKGKIAVVPSDWYEPMGGVVLELLASGKNLIVSETGGLKECAGAAALSFPNGDYHALAVCMCKLLNDAQLCSYQLEKAREQLQLFDPNKLLDKYIALLEEVV